MPIPIEAIRAARDALALQHIIATSEESLKSWGLPYRKIQKEINNTNKRYIAELDKWLKEVKKK
jgi:hypothetical protein